MKKCLICKIVSLLAGIGAVNWLLVALLNFNLVTTLLGDMTIPAKAVYTLVGIAGVITILTVFVTCPCMKKTSCS